MNRGQVKLIWPNYSPILGQFSLILTPRCETGDIIAGWLGGLNTVMWNTGTKFSQRTAASSSSSLPWEGARHENSSSPACCLSDTSWTRDISPWQPGCALLWSEDCFPQSGPARPGKKINTGGTWGGRGGGMIYNIYYLTLPGPPEVRFPNYFTVLVCWQSRSCRVACGHFPSF